MPEDILRARPPQIELIMEHVLWAIGEGAAIDADNPRAPVELADERSPEAPADSRDQDGFPLNVARMTRLLGQIIVEFQHAVPPPRFDRSLRLRARPLIRFLTHFLTHLLAVFIESA